MGQAKNKRRTAFPDALQRMWEAEDCVNFAVALARLTGWLLHVDWWSPAVTPDESVPLEQMKPLRVYVADNHDKVFDVAGVRSLEQFTERTIRPLAQRFGTGGVRTRYYSEHALSALPLRRQPDEDSIAAAQQAICRNEAYLASVPCRPAGGLPAHEAARFTFGQCVPFAQALQEQTGGVAVALLAKRFAPLYAGTRTGKDGYFHSVVLHANGLAEDSWGCAPLAEIAKRFGVLEYTISRDVHEVIVATLKRNSPERFHHAFEDARTMLAATPSGTPT